MSKIRRALLSVSDKRGVAEFAKGLAQLGVEIISSGGTAKALQDAGVKATPVSQFTGFPEMMDGRVKTLHPKIFGGILGVRTNEEHVREAKENGIEFIDVVAVNLYPFKQTVANPNVSLEEAIEQIDIGGPSLVRAAAKNHAFTTIIVDANDYSRVLQELSEKGETSGQLRRELALKAFKHTAEYDAAIANYLGKIVANSKFPDVLMLSLSKLQDLRYGENPHQAAALYADPQDGEPSVASAKQLQGKQLSYNNILDSNSALELVREFEETTAVIVKHNNPCGVASASSVLEAYKTARAVDPESAFGGIIALNACVEKELAQEIVSTFVEVVLAPSYSSEALEMFKTKKNVRVLEVSGLRKPKIPCFDYRSVVGGLLAQERNVQLFAGDLKVVSKRAPTEEEWKALNYAWRVCKHVKSNAIVYARGDRAVGIGAGQMKRIDSAKLGAMIASGPITGTVMASDAFFPFRDGIDAAAKLGITAVIQPGGSIRDEDVINAVNEHKLAMVFTGIRHFRH